MDMKACTDKARVGDRKGRWGVVPQMESASKPLSYLRGPYHHAALT